MNRRTINTTLAGALLAAAPLLAQPGRSGDWMTSGNDAQRSSWVRADGKISVAPAKDNIRVRRRARLSGLINEYSQVA